MSTPGTSPALPLDSTRQQLDELDNLIHEMLGLPAIPTPDEPRPKPVLESTPVSEEERFFPVVRFQAVVDPHALLPPPAEPASAATLEAVVPPTAEGGSETRAVEPPTPNLDSVEPNAETAASPPAQAAPGSPLTLGQDRLQDPGAGASGSEGKTTAPAQAKASGRARRQRFPLWLAPVVWANRAFDRSTYLLGPAGRWLRGPSGRSVVGWAGVGFLAAALGWALLDWLRWNWWAGPLE